MQKVQVTAINCSTTRQRHPHMWVKYKLHMPLFLQFHFFLIFQAYALVKQDINDVI